MPGDDVAVPADWLGFSEDKRMVELYVEAIKRSESEEDRTIEVVLEYEDASEEGEGGSKRLDFAFTVLQAETVGIGANGTVSYAETMEDSNSSPLINVTRKEVTNVYPSPDGSQILADFAISGTVTCGICDLIPGADGVDSDGDDFIEGTVNKLYVFLNQYEDPVIPNAAGAGQDWVQLTVSKAAPGDAASTFGRPYAFSARFDDVYFTGIPIEACTNKLILTSTFEGAPGHRESSSFTGFAEFLFDVNATLPSANSPTPVTTYSEITTLNLQQVSGGYQLEVQTATSALKTYDLGAVISRPTLFVSELVDFTPTAWFERYSDASIALSAPAVGIWDALIDLEPVPGETGKFRIKRSPQVELFFESIPNPEALNTMSVRFDGGAWVDLVETEIGSDYYSSDEETVHVRLLSGHEVPDTTLEIHVSNTDFDWFERLFSLDLASTEDGYEYTTHDVPQLDEIIGSDEDAEAGLNFGYVFSSTLANNTPLSAYSDGGYTRGYGVRLRGPDTLLDQYAEGDNVMKRDGMYFSCRVDESAVSTSGTMMSRATLTAEEREATKVALRSSLVLEKNDNWWNQIDFSAIGGDTLKFLGGFAKGFGMGAKDCLTDTVKGIGGMIWDKASSFFKSPMETAVAGFDKKIQTFRTTSKVVKIIAEAIYKYCHDGDLTVINRIAAGQYPEINDLSDELRMTMEFMADMLKDLFEKFRVAIDVSQYKPFDQGEAFGKMMFEVFTWIQPYAKAGKLSKLGGKLTCFEGIAVKMEKALTAIPGVAHVRNPPYLPSMRLDSKATVSKSRANAKKAVDKTKPSNLPKSKKSTRTSARIDVNYDTLKATMPDPMARLKTAVEKSSDPPTHGWDGFLIQVYEAEMTKAYGTNTYPSYKWSNDIWSKSGLIKLNRKAPKKKSSSRAYKIMWSNFTLEVHHGVPEAVQEKLIPIATQRIDPDKTPSMQMTHMRHQAAQWKNPLSTHRILKENSLGQQDVEKAVTLIRRNVQSALTTAYKTTQIPKFGKISVNWLRNHFKDNA